MSRFAGLYYSEIRLLLDALTDFLFGESRGIAAFTQRLKQRKYICEKSTSVATH